MNAAELDEDADERDDDDDEDEADEAEDEPDADDDEPQDTRHCPKCKRFFSFHRTIGCRPRN